MTNNFGSKIVICIKNTIQCTKARMIQVTKHPRSSRMSSNLETVVHAVTEVFDLKHLL